MSGSKVTWKPEVYLNFAAYRARPVDDLLPRIAPPDHGTIFDLGCGPGNVTAKLKARWPARSIVGVDSSAEMLEVARKAYPDGIAWQLGDISSWTTPSPAALIFANAALHWVGAHERLFPHLARSLAPGGVLAVQMPVGQEAPYHTHLNELAFGPRWRDKLAKGHRQRAPLSPGAYYDLLTPLLNCIDIWQTDYHHVLEGQDPVVAWAAGTALRPYTSLLGDDEAAEFTAAYADALRKSYPPQPDGRTIFCMRRIFIVGKKRS